MASIHAQHQEAPQRYPAFGLHISNNVESRKRLYDHQSLQFQFTGRVWHCVSIGLLHILRLEGASHARGQVFSKPICYI